MDWQSVTPKGRRVSSRYRYETLRSQALFACDRLKSNHFNGKRIDGLLDECHSSGF